MYSTIANTYMEHRHHYYFVAISIFTQREYCVRMTHISICDYFLD